MAEWFKAADLRSAHSLSGTGSNPVGGIAVMTCGCGESYGNVAWVSAMWECYGEDTWGRVKWDSYDNLATGKYCIGKNVKVDCVCVLGGVLLWRWSPMQWYLVLNGVECNMRNCRTFFHNKRGGGDNVGRYHFI